MQNLPARTAGIGAVALLTLGLAACGSESSGSAGATTQDAIRVVASTNVYGDIAATIGGDAVDVTSVISSPSQDPHSFEADTRTQLAISKADLVIENGGGYDDFMDKMRKSAGGSATVVNAVEISGKTAPAGGELNEHVWYDLPSVQRIADTIAADLGKARPGQAAEFTANAAAFKTELDTIGGLQDAAKAKFDGEGVAITEPVPLYLLSAMGLVDKTPQEFSEAIEEGTDVPVGVLNSTLKLFSGGAVKALVYNEQTSGAETEKVLAEARKDDVPAVGVTETLPDGKNYVEWMTANVRAVTAALGS